MTVRAGAPYRATRRGGARRRLAVRGPPRIRGRSRRPRAARRARRATLGSRPSTRAAAPCRSIVDLAPAAGWDEREAHDLYGVSFDGPRAAAAARRPRPRRSRSWTVPVRGDDAYQVAVGPIHAGVIESGHFRFHVVGERILHLDARLFYKHRGLERAAEGRDARGRRSHSRRAPAPRARSPTRVAYAQACEETLGLAADGRARPGTDDPARARAALEPPQRHRRRLRRRRPRRREQHISPRSRSARAASTPGSPAIASCSARSRWREPLDLDAAAVREAREELQDSATDAERGWRELQFNASFQDRLPDVGILTPRTSCASAPSALRRARRASSRRLDPLRPGSTTRSSCVRRPSGRPETSGPGRSSGCWSCARRSTCSTGSSTALSGRPARRGRVRGRPSASGPWKPAGATLCVVEPDGDAIGRVASAHRLVRELAVRHVRGGRQPAPRLSPHQQELRALLRLRRPLMLTLLRDLRRLRRTTASRGPTVAGAWPSATSTRAPATAASTS